MKHLLSSWRVLLVFALWVLMGLPARSATADPLASWHVRLPPTNPTAENFEGVAFGNSRWVVVGEDGSIISSPDGIEWVQEVNPAAPARLDDVAFGGGIFVAVGRAPKMVLTSPDGRKWTKQEPEVSGFHEIIYDGSRFIGLLSGGFIITSPNGVEWAQPTRVPAKYDVGGIAHGNGVHMEVGYKRTGQPPEVFSSSNFSDWLPRDSKLDQNLMNVGFGLGQFIIVGQGGALATSVDGVEWTPRNVPHTGFIWDVVQGGDFLVAAAQWGRLLTSPDGANWIRRETDLPWHLTDIAFGQNTFVAVGWDGQIVQSDPIHAEPPGEFLQITSCDHKGGQFSLKFNGTPGRMYEIQVSTDTVKWVALGSVEGVGPGTVFSEPSGNWQRFYRVRQE